MGRASIIMGNLEVRKGKRREEKSNRKEKTWRKEGDGDKQNEKRSHTNLIEMETK